MKNREEVKELRIGTKIHNLRIDNRLTLQELSDLSGLSKPLLSQIENDQVIPPIATLLKIAKGLRVNINFFFEDPDSKRKFVIMRSDEINESRLRAGYGAPDIYLYKLLAYGMRNQSMAPFIIDFESYEWNDLYFYSHEGEEFIYILEGEVEVHYGKEVITLREGDSIYFNSNEPHGFVSKGGIAKALSIIFSGARW
ncbi:MAG: cupin domain-containing protein [Desulfuromonadales bacterium]|nr:cupin domain-containing protein [Desulfuromonadales bacterium]